MHKPRIRASQSVDTFQGHMGKKSSGVLARRESYNPESKQEKVAICMPPSPALYQQTRYQRVSRKLCTHYETVDKWKEKYVSGSSDKRIVRKMGLEQSQILSSTPKRASVVELPRIIHDTNGLMQRFSFVDRSRNMKQSEPATTHYPTGKSMPMYGFQILHQQPSTNEQPNSLFPEMSVGRKLLSETTVFKRKDYSKLEDNLVPYKPPIKRRSDFKANKTLNRPYFDWMPDRMTELPTAWNQFEEEHQDEDVPTTISWQNGPIE